MRLGPKMQKPSHQDSVSGVPVETVVGVDGGRWWSGGYEVMVVVGGRVRSHKQGWQVLAKCPKLSH